MEMNEENFTEAEGGTPTHKEKATAIKMFCWQIVYLLLIYPVYSYYENFRRIFLGPEGRCIVGFIIFLFETSPFLGRIFIAISIFYSIISVLSFCVFIWAYVTGNLQKPKVRFMCHLPFYLVLICVPIMFMLHYESNPRLGMPRGFPGGF